MLKNSKISVIGLGYVGLPLAHAFSSKYKIVGFDIAQWRIDELRSGHDRTLELSETQVKEAISNGMEFTNKLEDIKDCNIYIVTVPTPIDKHKKPDLTPLLKASETVGKVLKKDDIVIYESTVYPGATEEDCVPILERVSGLKFNEDFFCGYSPERINLNISSSSAPYKLYNIGNNAPLPLMKFIKTIEDALGKKAKKNFMPMQDGDVVSTYADVSGLIDDFGCKPNTDLKDGISEFVTWYRGFYGESK